MIKEIRQAIEDARDKDVMIYVHGAKVDFYNASAFAAQLDHFMGRDMTSIAFSRPTRRNILAYGLGDDVARGKRSAPALASLIRIVADYTNARRINIVTWSAGGRVVTEALTQLHDRYPEDSPDRIRERFRIGTVYNAASDVLRDEFLEALPKINDLVQRVVVTGSSNDDALRSGAIFLGGSTRIGQITEEPVDPERLEAALKADRLEYADVSSGYESRGFDITGHRYWFNHPWASSDRVLAIRTDLAPQERGLEQGEYPVHWLRPPDYPERLRAIMNDPDVTVKKA